MPQPANDDLPSPKPPAGFVRIIGVVTDDGRVILSRPIARPTPPARPLLRLVRDPA